MRKSLLAVSAIVGAGVILPQKAEAFSVKLDDEATASLVFRQQIRATHLGERNTTDKSDIRFLVPNAGIVINGQVNKQTKFWIEWAGSADRNFSMNLVESTVQLDLMPELKIQAGVHRIPVWRPYMVSGYTYIVPTGYAYGHVANVVRPLQQASDLTGDGPSFRHGGLQLWGVVADGLLRYHLGVYDVVDQQTNGQNSMYTLRLQFTPTMLGFKAETSYGLNDTYLGKQNVLSIGLGYASQNFGKATPTSRDVQAKETALDIFWEQKFGALVPGVMFAYKKAEDLGGDAARDGSAVILQGQLMSSGKLPLGPISGQPAVAFRYSQSDADTYASSVDPNFRAGRDTTTLGVYLNYYIKGQNAKIQLGADTVSIKNKAAGRKNYTDFILQLQTQF